MTRSSSERVTSPIARGPRTRRPPNSSTGSPGTVFTAGDNVYENGTATEFTNCYGPTWGPHKARTRPTAGNHEYQTSGASGYYGYFGSAAGDPSKGYYSFDIGSWHGIVLNSNCSQVGGCGASSPQTTWLRNDLAAHPASCTVAIWHHPRYSSSRSSPDGLTAPLWQALYDAGAELIIGGHYHNYERFALQTPAGAVDNAFGIREVVVGTGGVALVGFSGGVMASSLVRNNATDGVLKLTLDPTSYDFAFVPIAGQSSTDFGYRERVTPRRPRAPRPQRLLRPISSSGRGPATSPSNRVGDGRWTSSRPTSGRRHRITSELRLTAPPTPYHRPMERVGFVGLGTMGGAMAANLARAGFEVTAWNRTPGRARRARRARRRDGARPRPTAAADADIVVICVSDTPDVEAVLFGPDGVVGGRRGRAPSSSTARRSRRRAAGTSPRGSREHGVAHGRRARVGRQRGRQEGDADDLRRRRRGRRRAGAAGPRRRSARRSPTSARSAPARRSRPSTRSSSPAPTSASPRASSSRSRPASTSSRSSTALGGGAAQSWVLANRSGRMIDNDYPLGFKVALHRKDLGIALELAARARRRRCRSAPCAAQLETGPDRQRPRRRRHVRARPRDPRAVRPRRLRPAAPTSVEADQQHRVAQLAVVARPEALDVVHHRRRRPCAARAPGRAAACGRTCRPGSRPSGPVTPLVDEVHRDVGERRRDHRVERVGLAAAQVVGQLGGERLDAGPRSELVGQRLADVGLVAVAERVGLADVGRSCAPCQIAPSAVMTNA